MKDALGHGSNKRGMAGAKDTGKHQTGVLRVGRTSGNTRVGLVNGKRQVYSVNAPGRILVQMLNTALAGKPWQTVGRYRNRATAERQAQYQRVDNRHSLVRIK